MFSRVGGITMENLTIENKDAFALLYQKHIDELIEYSLRLTADKELIKDVIQDTFVQLWQRREKLENIISVKAYLITCIRREIIKRIKNSRLTNNDFNSQEFVSVECTEDLVMKSHDEKLRSEKIIEAVKRLPIRQQEVIFLRFYSELEFFEIAKIMNIRLRSVYKVLYKALNNLKGNFSANMLR